MRPPAWLVGEFFGTFLLVFFGCGSVAAAVLTGALSGAHLNPAVTCALATCGRFPARQVAPYVAVQFAGAFAAAAVLQAVFAGPLAAFELAHGIVRGAPGSEATAMIFGEFFPNPGGHALTEAVRAVVTPGTAFFVEALGTAILVLVIFSVTDARNEARPRELTAATIGLTITLLISLLAPLTQAGFNPARDLGPRVWSALAGWGSVPFTANGWGWLTVYVLAPLAGGQAGGILYRVFFRPAYAAGLK